MNAESAPRLHLNQDNNCMKDLIIKSAKMSSILNQVGDFHILKKKVYSLMSPDLVIKNWELNKNLIFIVIFMYNIQVAKLKLKFLKSGATVSSEILIVQERLCFGEGGSLSFSQMLLITINFNNDCFNY